MLDVSKKTAFAGKGDRNELAGITHHGVLEVHSRITILVFFFRVTRHVSRVTYSIL
jgi:hypothetical protein